MTTYRGRAAAVAVSLLVSMAGILLAGTNQVEFTSMGLISGRVAVSVSGPSEITSRWDVFAYDPSTGGYRGVAGIWSIAETNILVSSGGVVTWGETTPDRQKFYVLGNAVVDNDHDQLEDARELLVYKTSAASLDTDADGMPDGWEVQQRHDPLRGDAAEDSDADGFANLFECLGQSDSRDGARYPSIVAATNVADTNCYGVIPDLMPAGLPSSLVFTQLPPPGAVADVGPQLVILALMDAESNWCRRPYIVEVRDATPPVVAPLESLHVERLPDVPLPDPDIIFAEDACGGTHVEHIADVTSGGAGCADDPRVIYRAYRVEDEFGNAVVCTQEIIVAGHQPISLTPPADVWLNPGASSDPTNTGVPILLDACCVGSGLAYADADTGTCERLRFRVWTATNSCGDVAVVTQRIMVADTIAPVFRGVPSNLVLGCQDMVPGPADVAAEDDVAQRSEQEGQVRMFTMDRIQDGHLIDDSTNHADGVVAGATMTSAGHEGGALEFDGIDDRVDVSLEPANDQGSFTAIAWIRTENAGSGVRRVLYRSAAMFDWYLGLNDNVLICGSTRDGAQTTAGAALNDGQWHMLAAVRDSMGRQFRGYVDGVELFSQPSSPGPPTFSGTDHGLTLGATWDGLDAYSGWMDDVQVLDRPMSASEIRTIFLGLDPARVVAVTMDEEADYSSICTEVIRTWSAQDRCGNIAVATQFISIVDAEPPSFSGLGDSVELTWPEPLPGTGIVVALDACLGGVTTRYSERHAGADPAVITRVWRAADTCGNEASATQSITVLGGDIDQDGMGDFWELAWVDKDSTDALVAVEDVLPSGDEDGDGLENRAEYEFGTDPFSRDTDLDWVGDAREVEVGTDPADAASVEPVAISINHGDLVSTSRAISVHCSEGLVADVITISDTNSALVGMAYPFTNAFFHALSTDSNGWRTVSVCLHRLAAPHDLCSAATMLVDTEPPMLTLERPLQDTVTARRWIDVVGTATDAAGLVRVTVNGHPVSGMISNRFWYNRVPLVAGTNTIRIVGRDEIGCAVTQDVRVIQDTSCDTNAPHATLNLPRDFEVVGQETNWYARATYGSAQELYVDGACDDESAFVAISVVGGDVTNGPFTAQVLGTSVWGQVALREGSNVLRVIASDAAGNTSTSDYIVVRTPGLVFAITNPAAYAVVGNTGVVVMGEASSAFLNARIEVNGVPADVVDCGDHVAFATVRPVPLGDGPTPLRGAADLDGVSYYCDPPTSATEVYDWLVEAIHRREVTRDRCSDQWVLNDTITGQARWNTGTRAVESCSTRAWRENWIEYKVIYEGIDEPVCSSEPMASWPNRPLTLGYSSEVRAFKPFTDMHLCTLPAGWNLEEFHGGAITIRLIGAGVGVQAAIFRFESLQYSTPAGGTVDVSRISFKGQPGTRLEDGSVAFIVQVDVGLPVTVSEADFVWPMTVRRDEITQYTQHLLTLGGLSVTLIRDGIVDDQNHDGSIDLNDKITTDPVMPGVPGDENEGGGPPATNNWPLRIWINDDSDNGQVADGYSDTPGALTGWWELDGRTPNYSDDHVNGYCDLLDFFPVLFDLHRLLQLMPPGPGTEYFLRQEDEAVNIVYTDLSPGRAGAFQKEKFESGFGTQLDQAPERARTVRVTRDGIALDREFLTRARDGDKGVLLVEGRTATTNPLVLEIRSPNAITATVELPLRVSPVEDMYRWVNLRPVAGQDAVRPTDTDEPPNAPDEESNGANFVFVHGYNVNEYDARGFDAEVFKRMWQSGSRARYTAVTWHGDKGQIWDWIPILNGMDPDYYANVTNAFVTAQALSQALQFMEGQAIVISAHSLGNMVVSAAIQDFGLRVRKYYMIDAAVAIEAYDAGVSHRAKMTNPHWVDYVDATRPDNPYRFWSSEWHTLFDTGDVRRTLTWRNRFGGITNAINYYSSTEDVLAGNDSGGIPPLGRDRAWVAQEMMKGSIEAALSSGFRCQGGWGFNFEWHKEPIKQGGMELLDPWEIVSNSDDRIRSSSFFNKFDTKALYGPDGSTVASDYMKRSVWLSEGLPALTYAAGGSPVDRFPPDRNRDISQRFRNGELWPLKKWGHSDFVRVAYFHTFGLYQDFIAQGGL